MGSLSGRGLRDGVGSGASGPGVGSIAGGGEDTLGEGLGWKIGSTGNAAEDVISLDIDGVGVLANIARLG